MKKLIAIVLSMLLVLAMAACGDSAPAQPYIPPVANGTNPPAASGESTAPTGSVAVPVLPGQQEQVPVTEATEPRTETEPQVTEGTEPPIEETKPPVAAAVLDYGSVSGNVYNNWVLDLTFEAPEELQFADEATLNSMNGVTGRMELNEKAEQVLVYTMYSQSADGTTAVTTVAQRLGHDVVQAMDMKESLENQIDSVRSSYTGMGFSEVEVVYDDITLSGKRVDGLFITAEAQGQTFYGAVLQYGTADFVVKISLGSYSMDVSNQLLEAISIG